jgi:hypothetical protein
MLGAAYYAEFTNPEHIFGKFNAHLANMAVVVLNEAYWRGDHKAEANLKALITDPTFIAERKFGAVAVISNSLMVIMLANARWVVPANLKNRRFRVYDVTEVHLRDFAFFKELARAMDNGGRAAMLHDMLSWDLDDWHPRMSAPTKGTQQQQALSAPAHIVWLVAALEDPTQCFSTRDSFGLRTVVKGASTWNKGPLVLGSLTDIHTAYTQWCQNNVQVWKRNSEHLDALQLMHHLKETLNTSDEPLLYQQRKRLEKMQHPTRIWCLAERPVIVKRLKSLYPGLFER